jgi:hypothetical protein
MINLPLLCQTRVVDYHEGPITQLRHSRIEVSREDVLLRYRLVDSTKAGQISFGRVPNPPEEPFVLHNVDVHQCTIDLRRRKVQFSRRHNTLWPTLSGAGHAKTSSLPYCLTSSAGFAAVPRGTRWVKSELVSFFPPDIRPCLLAGSTMISPRFIPLMTEEGHFFHHHLLFSVWPDRNQKHPRISN